VSGKKGGGNTHDKRWRDISLGLSSECGEIGDGMHGADEGWWPAVVAATKLAAEAAAGGLAALWRGFGAQIAAWI